MAELYKVVDRDGVIVADGTPKTGGHAKGLQKRRAATIAAQAKGRQVVPLDAPPPIED